jgi:hypothetical protein
MTCCFGSSRQAMCIVMVGMVYENGKSPDLLN